MMRITVLAVLVGCAVPAMAGNLLVNGDFETGNLSGWTTRQYQGTGIATADARTYSSDGQAIGSSQRRNLAIA